MKRTITLLTTLSLLLALLAIGASAEPTTTVYVTVAVKGELVATQARVKVTDVDDDGVLTVNDALYAAHQKLYDGGAEAGYGYYTGEYGLSMSKLWGDESGAYGYYLNNTSCMSLADPVKDGDSITAFVYKNADWTDVYCYFDAEIYGGFVGDEILLTLMAMGYDENWNPITYPVEGATIIVDGQPSSMVTNAEGKVWYPLERMGSTIVSATSDTVTLVPPAACITAVVAEGTGTSTDDSTEEPVTDDSTEEPATMDSTEEPVTDADNATTGCKAFAGVSLIALLPLAFFCGRKEK